MSNATSLRGGEFADWFRGLLGERKLPAGWRAAWARCFDNLRRLDARSEKEIAAVCLWARGNQFWRKNFFTPLKLRQWQQDAEGNKTLLYFDVFAEALAEERGAGPALPRAVLDALERCHTAFCEAARRREPFRLHAAAWQALARCPEYEEGGEAQLAADVRHVAWYLARGIASGDRQPGALKLTQFLVPVRFFADLAEARRHGKGYFQTTAAKSAPALHGAGKVPALPMQAAPDDAERARLAAKAKAMKAELQRQLAGGAL